MVTDRFEIKDGSLRKTMDTVTFEIAKEKTNILADEQLEELKRDSELFLTCRQYNIEESMVQIHYQIDHGFKSLTSYVSSNREFKCKLARSILTVDNLFGTQYTTLVHPDNIYANNEGNIKFAHRGIRSVLPPEEYTSFQLLQDLKNVFLYLFTTGNTATHAIDQDIVQRIQAAASIEQLRKALEPSQVNQQPITNKFEDKEKIASKKLPSLNRSKLKVERKSLIIGVTVGILLGMLFVYAGKVVPSTKAASATTSELDEQQDENKTLQKELEQKEAIIKGYQFVISGETEEAIAALESVQSLDENANKVLAGQYIQLNTLESLSKALDLNKSYEGEVVVKLLALNSEEANQKILSIKSDQPQVKIEQAWLNKDYKQVLEIYKEIADNNRAKSLAAQSYIQINKPKEALKIAKALKNKDLQIKSLQKEKELIKANDALDKDEKKSKTENIDKQIKKLK